MEWRGIMNKGRQIGGSVSSDNIQINLKRLQMAGSKKNMKPGPYQTELPDFLLQVIDQIIKIDTCHVLRHQFLRQSLDHTVYEEIDHPPTIWLFIDPNNHDHLLSKAPHLIFDLSKDPPPPNSSQQQPEPMPLSTTLACTNVLASHIDSTLIEDLRKSQIVSIDQVRLRCEANLYTEAIEMEKDLRRIISWNQVFRANSIKTFQYLSVLYQKIVAYIAKKDFFKRFTDIKQSDLTRLMKEQLQFKLAPSQWPFIPTSFREYEQLEEYIPTPDHRTPIINQRIRSEKVPIECGSDCVCLSEHLPQGEIFCSFNLIHGWQTKCPNRALKIQCAHAREEDQLRCRNSQIKKHQRKKCLGKGGSDQGESQIQQRITWGVDYYTRNVIYHCLPQCDIINTIEKLNNEQNRNIFIQRTLAKAFNLMGPQGYSLVDVCNYIKKHSEHNAKYKMTNGENQSNGDTIVDASENSNKQWLFTDRDQEYADLLIKNYELSPDKTGFRVHTKGKGAICIDKTGIQQGTFIVEYFGEVYEPWRWYDREDFIKQVMKKKKFKNYMPQFYNIALEKHPDQPLGCDMLMVDPSRKGNFSSRFSHSCDPNCGTIITVSDGRYYIGMYAIKDIVFGEELTFDYCSMTESNYEHNNSICLCGMKKCRGFYLQLSNTKMFNNLMDNKNCFFTRNSAILKANQEINEEDYNTCAKSNIKSGLLMGSPNWLIKWIASVLKFIEEQGEVYKKSLVQSWRKNYPWQNAQNQEEKQQNIQKYSLTSRQQLQNIRLQNLLTSVDKIKYFLSKNQDNQQPPIFIENIAKILEVLVFKEDSVLLQLQQSLIRYKMEALANIIERFFNQIKATSQDTVKLSIFRFCCLIISHRLLFIQDATFNSQLLSDIVYFYAFTHTYFSPTQYKSFEAEEITVSVSEILGERGHPNERREKSKKKYASPFLWGQMASWYKQTIVCPEASLSQDRRGTLSYPLIRSIMRSGYPYEKQNQDLIDRESRNNFLKVIREKPANSWPPAPGCDLSFKNPYKLYGTILFQNIHSRQRLSGHLPRETLLESCLSMINAPLIEKFQVFKKVQEVLGGVPSNHEMYELLSEGGDLHLSVPIKQPSNKFLGEPRKRVKRQSSDSP